MTENGSTITVQADIQYLGVDPGKSGGLALWCGPHAVEAYPMPPTMADLYGLIAKLVHDARLNHARIFALVEKVGGMPGQGGHASFVFGEHYGHVRMALQAERVPQQLVTPRTWQKGMGVSARKKTESKAKFKNRLKAKASELFPGLPVTLKTCDALLIAAYAAKHYQDIHP